MRRYHLKIFLFLALQVPILFRKQRDCVNFGRGNISVFGSVVQEEMSFKGILSFGSHFVHQSGMICAILVEGIMGNIYVKLL